VPFLHVSTDYVFDGAGDRPFRPDDPTGPLGAYGRSKLAGEIGVRAAGGNAAILRTSWVVSVHGANFVKTMLRLGRERDSLNVVADQVTAPTNTAEIAEALLPLVLGGARGTIHLAAGEGCSWHTFASAIFEIAGLSPDLNAVTTEQLGGPVKRPTYSVLGTSRAPSLRHWRAGLERYMREKHG